MAFYISQEKLIDLFVVFVVIQGGKKQHYAISHKRAEYANEEKFVNHCGALRGFRDGDKVCAQNDLMPVAHCGNARGHRYHFQEPILFPSL